MVIVYIFSILNVGTVKKLSDLSGQNFAANFSRQNFPANFSRQNSPAKIFPPKFPRQNFPAKISPPKFPRQNFPANFSRQNFPANFSRQNFPAQKQICEDKKLKKSILPIESLCYTKYSTELNNGLIRFALYW